MTVDDKQRIMKGTWVAIGLLLAACDSSTTKPPMRFDLPTTPETTAEGLVEAFMKCEAAGYKHTETIEARETGSTYQCSE